MSNEADDLLAYLGGGPLLAILLGFALVPLRESTSASNLSFAFVVLTVVVSAFGGRAAGVATALVSALSMDFFLTQPYLSLRIQDHHDLFAFVGLAVCGLVAATLGSRERIAALGEARRHLSFLHAALVELEGAGPLETELTRILHAARDALPVKALAVRDARDQLLAACPHPHAMLPVPALVLRPEASFQSLPVDGTRLGLVTHNRQVGWLDLWGDGSPTSDASRRTLSDMARLLGAVVARGQRT